MLTHRGFSAWIVVDGKPLPEYLVAVDSKLNRVSCWVPSDEGKNFSVHWKDHGGKVDTCSFITLDGFIVPGRFLFGSGTASRQGVRTSPAAERPFVFQKVDESASETSDGPTKDVGMITLRIKRVVRVENKPANSMQELPKTLLGKRKPGDFCVGFGEEKGAEAQHPSTWSVVAHEKNARSKQPSTYVSFVFRYRSREFLEAQGIMVETEPEPVPEAPKRPPIRRVVSLPSSMLSLDVVKEPPRKKTKLAMIPPVGPRSRPTQERRTASCKVEPQKQVDFMAQRLFTFHASTPESPWGDSGTSSPGTSSPETGFSHSSPIE